MKKKIFLVILVFVLITISFSSSFSYIGTKIIMPETKETSFKTGNINILIEDDKLSNINLLPIYDRNYKSSAYNKQFEIVSNSSLNACTSVYLNISNVEGNIKSKYLKYRLESKDDSYEGDFSTVVSNENLLLANNLFIESNSKNTYNLYIWISYDENENQNDLLNTSFNAKVLVKSYDAQTKEGCTK